jgi:hypothetical protein
MWRVTAGSGIAISARMHQANPFHLEVTLAALLYGTNHSKAELQETEHELSVALNDSDELQLDRG